ncbi:MAG TPA: adenylate/guanylate cyclase domain-containing protein [Baekduia sp.]|nr:adenylate/guanylate cyclase domain-containing protein [Baekduia sp.]
MARTLRWLNARLGRRYLRVMVFAQFQVAHLVVAGAVVVLNSYVELSATEFWRIMVFAQAFVLVENCLAFWWASRALQPADAWIAGDRSPSAAIRAWQAVASLPRDFLTGKRALPVALNIVPLSAYVLIELGAPFWPSFFIILAGAGIVLLYAAFLRFFGIEFVVRPVLELISEDLPDDARLGARTVSVKLRVLFGLPTINIISGVVIAGITAPDDGGLADLAVGVLVTLGVAFTVSLAMSALLIRSILTPLQEIREGTRKVLEGDLSVRVPVLGSDEAGSLAGSFNQMVAGLEERRKLRAALEAYVAPELVSRVLDEGPELEARDVEVTVMFLDIRNFTAFAEKATAREVIERLNGFYELVVPVVVGHGGHLDNFIGDGLLAVFGAPERLDDHADRAVKTAIEVAGRVQDAYGDDLRIGIGVNTGQVVTGSIGGGGRFDVTVIGDAVNTAARVEAVTRMTGDVVLVTQATRDALIDLPCEFIERGEVELKGKVERVHVHAPVVLDSQRAAPHLRSA